MYLHNTKFLIYLEDDVSFVTLGKPQHNWTLKTDLRPRESIEIVTNRIVCLRNKSDLVPQKGNQMYNIQTCLC